MPEEQVVEQPQVTETPQEGGDEQLILGRFKSADDLAKSYQEAEKKITQQGQELAQYRKFQQELEMRNMFVPPAQEAKPEPEDLDSAFWSKPTHVLQTLTEKVIDSRLDFVYEQNYEAQKARYANDPNFKNYEGYIDQAIRANPELRKKNGVVDQLYKMVRGLTFNEDDYKKQIIEEYEKSKAAGMNNGIEGGSSPPSTPQRQQVNLSDDEKRTAIQLYPGMKPDEAMARYAASKAKMKGAI